MTELAPLCRMVTGVFALQFGEGARLDLEMALPVPGRDWEATSLAAQFVAPSREMGEAALLHLSAWLGVPLADEDDDLGAPVQVSFNWGVCKLTLDDGGAHAEVYLNLHDAPTHGECFQQFGLPRHVALVEKDDAYREVLLALWARAVRQSWAG